MNTRITLIHDRSNEMADADGYIDRGDTVVAVTFESPDPDLPIVVGDWYWLVVDGASTQYELAEQITSAGERVLELRR